MVSHVKKRTQRVFENRVATYFGEYLDRRRMKWRQAGENYILRTSTVLFVRLLLNKLLDYMIKSRRVRWEGHAERMREMRSS
jgi:hypothetical protein